MTTALITGANSGIGRATAVVLAQKGLDVYATMRDVSKAEKLLAMCDEAGVSVEVVALDVTSDESVTASMQDITDRSGGIDVLVNNAGIGGNAVTEFCSIETLEDVMNVNVYGPMRCIQAVLPQMRERGAGHIVNVTSVTGKISAIAQSPYSISKWAAEAMSEGLAIEVAPFGIRVAIIEPGITKSAIFAKNTEAPGAEIYEDAYRWMFQMYAAGIPTATPPEVVGETIHHAITTDDPKLRYPVGIDGEKICAGREEMTDEEWVAMGRAENDEAYHTAFERHFGLDIRPST